MNIDELREVPGYPGYSVTRDGRVSGPTRMETEWMSPALDRDGYLHLTMVDSKGKRKNMFVHRAVLLAWVGPCPPGWVACHSPDKTRTNNNVENLRWGTRRDNTDDMIKDGSAKGAKNNKCRLTEPQVREIRKLIEVGELTLVQISKIYSVQTPLIWKIKHKRVWAWLE